jgi:predicted transcriptional regulator
LRSEDQHKESEHESDDRLNNVFKYFTLVFADDIRYKIINVLASREGANLREIARCVGISHTNCSKYLSALVNKGVIDVYPVGQGMKVYKLSTKYDDLMRKFHHNYNRPVQ